MLKLLKKNDWRMENSGKPEFFYDFPEKLICGGFFQAERGVTERGVKQRERGQVLNEREGSGLELLVLVLRKSGTE